MKRAIIIIAILATVGLVVTLSVTMRSSGRGTPVQAEDAQRTDELVSTVSATGEIRPKEFVELQSEITGIITELYVQEGDQVKKGDLLLKIDPTQLELQTMAEKAAYEITLADATNQKAQIRVQESVVRRDESSVRRSQAELDKAKQNFDIAKSAFERKQQMFEDRLLSRDAYDAARNERIAAQTSLTSAQVSVEQAKAQLDVSSVVLDQEKVRYQNTLQRISQSKANLSRQQNEFAKTVIRSPLSGVITQMNVEVGERAVPGTLNNPSATLMIIADLSVIEAEVEVDETDIVNVQVGQDAAVKVDALPDQPLAGRVTEVGTSAIARSSNQEAKDFKVVVQLDSPPLSLRPGLSCTAEVTTAVRSDIVTIPIQALAIREYRLDESGGLIREPTAAQKRRARPKSGETPSQAPTGGVSTEKEKVEVQGVFKIDDQNAVLFVKVETGVVGETRIEVLSGLSAGDKIVTGSYKALRSLKDGEKVAPETEKKEGS